MSKLKTKRCWHYSISSTNVTKVLSKDEYICSSFIIIACFISAAHFRQLCTVSDWATTRRAFIEKYSLPFVLNMERELAKHFDLQCDIRSFVEQKFTALSTYTTLPLLNQMEHILSHLPSEIAILFINNEMMSGPKSKILSFCDGLKDCISSLRKETDEPRVEEDATYAQEPTNKMEVFEFVESD